MKAIALILALAGCGLQNIGGGAGLDLSFLDDATEFLDGTDVGDVFTCENYVDPELELCWRNDSAAELANAIDAHMPGEWTCQPTGRHSGPCLYSCSPHRGCNAFDGCYCPSM